MLRYGHTLTYLLHVWPLPASPPRLLVLPALLSPSSMGRFQLLLRATSLLQGLLHKLLFLFILFTFWPHWAAYGILVPRPGIEPLPPAPLQWKHRVFNCWTTRVVCSCSVAQSCLTLCDPVDCSTPGFPVHHQLPELAQTCVHWVSDAIQRPHPLLSPSPPALNLSQPQGLFQWVSSSHQVAKVLDGQGSPRNYCFCVKRSSSLFLFSFLSSFS